MTTYQLLTDSHLLMCTLLALIALLALHTDTLPLAPPVNSASSSVVGKLVKKDLPEIHKIRK